MQQQFLSFRLKVCKTFSRDSLCSFASSRDRLEIALRVFICRCAPILGFDCCYRMLLSELFEKEYAR